MTESVIQAYIKHNHLKVEQGVICDNSIFMPHLLMDLVLQIYNREVVPVKLKFMPNHWKKEWAKSYKKFNDRFFEAFNEDQTAEVIEAMDGLEEYVGPELEAMRESIRGSLTLADGKERDLLVSCILAVTLTNAAQVFWTRKYRTGKKFLPNPLLLDICDNILKLIGSYYTGKDDLRIGDMDAADEASDALCRKVVEWSRIKC